MITQQDQKTQSMRWASPKFICSSLEKKKKFIYSVNNIPFLDQIKDGRINVISKTFSKKLKNEQKIVGKQKYKKRKNSI